MTEEELWKKNLVTVDDVKTWITLISISGFVQSHDYVPYLCKEKFYQDWYDLVYRLVVNKYDSKDDPVLARTMDCIFAVMKIAPGVSFGAPFICSEWGITLGAKFLDRLIQIVEEMSITQ